MASKQKSPVIVAELGRPETAGETAARKSENSRLYKARKTVNNLVFSLLVSLGLVLVIVLVVPRGTDQWTQHSVDVAEAAEQNAPTVGQQLVAPEVPATWKAKQAALSGEQGSDILSWRINYTTENEAYATVVQALTKSGEQVNETWIGIQLEGQEPTGSETLGGLKWTVYDHPKNDPRETNMVFGLQSQIGTTTLLVYGTDRPEVLRTLAAQVAEQARGILPDAAVGGDPETSRSTVQNQTEETG